MAGASELRPTNVIQGTDATSAGWVRGDIQRLPKCFSGVSVYYLFESGRGNIPYGGMEKTRAYGAVDFDYS
jgi:hypothetical protein